MTDPKRTHGYGGSPSDQEVPEPTFAERTRTLLHTSRIGTLSTQSVKCPGHPFGSVMPYGLDDAGRPIFLISTMAVHTQNLIGDPKASLLVNQLDHRGDALGGSRVTLLGEAVPLGEDDLPHARELYLAAYEQARYWVDFDDFAFYRMEVEDLYYVGGFGVMGWVDAAEYAGAQPDPLCESASGILEHMNADHAEALIELARALKGIEASEARLTGIDRLGFQLRLQTPERVRGVRINFPAEVRTADDTRQALIGMLKEIRA